MSSVWETLTTTATGDANNPAVQREVAEKAIAEWWAQVPLTRYQVPDGVHLVFLGANFPPHRATPSMRLKYTVPEDVQKPYYLFYATQNPNGDLVTISVFGFAARERLVVGETRPMLRELLRDRRHGWDEWRNTFPRTRLAEEEVRDEKTGQVIQRERWVYEETASASEGLPISRRQLFTFPLRHCMQRMAGISQRCSVAALFRRGVYFVGEYGWRGVISDEECWALWDEQGGCPAPLKLHGEAELTRAFYYGSVAAAIDPKGYGDVRHALERSYVRYRLRRRGFRQNERATVALLQANGLGDWLLDVADVQATELFRHLYPDLEAPRLCGWLPAAECPPKWMQERPLKRGRVLIFYPDVEDIVLRVMQLEQRQINAYVMHYAEQLRSSGDDLVVMAHNLSAHAHDVMIAQQDQALGKGGWRPQIDKSADKEMEPLGSLNLEAAKLVDAMPPCMRRMYEASKRVPRNLRDGERPWFARFLLDLGYPKSMYDTLIRPHWEAEERASNRPTGDSQWKGAWDSAHVWQKRYGKPTCQKIIAQTLNAPQVFTDSKTRQRVVMPRCECPYARSVKNDHETADIESVVSMTTRHCYREWAKTNPSKVRDHEKPLYYPSQYVYLNLRRPRIAIELETDAEVE